MSDDLDLPIYGVPAIARILNLLDENGEPDLRRTYYALEKGHADGSKFGRVWTSTKRRLLAPHLAHIAA
jgi:hypothetical protein